MLLLFFFKVKQDFFELLSDYHVDGQQRWSKVKEKMETDPRYKAVETSASREELFKNYVERLAKVSEAASLYTLYCANPTNEKYHFRNAWKYRAIEIINTFT